MLSIRDCLDYCDLTDEEIALFAAHHDIPDAAAAAVVCGLVQSSEGVRLLTLCLQELQLEAERIGEFAQAERIAAICRRFTADHPLPG